MTEVSNIANTVLTTLDIGSGIDSAKLARDLTDAVKLPQQNIIQKKIEASEASISAYALLKFQIDELKVSFEKLNDANELATSTGISSNSAKISISAVAGTASSGAYDFTISQLAQNQRVTSDQYTSKTQSLNSGSSFEISLAVGTTKSDVVAIYNATSTSSVSGTLVIGDGTNTVSVANNSYSSIAAQVSAIQTASGYDNLLFTVAENSDGDGIAFTYNAAGPVASTPTFTGSGSTHTITNPTLGVGVATPVAGVAAKYTATGTASETTDLVVSDGTTTLTVASATYTSIAEQVTAIKAASGYNNLKFTISANSSNNGFIFDYKTTGAVNKVPTLEGNAVHHTISNSISGITAVNSATTTTIDIETDTPAGVVSAINAANTGVTAKLIDTGTNGNSFKILLMGETGSNGVFTLTSSPDLGFHDTANTLQIAQDSKIEFEGLSLTRSSNILTDVIDGTTLNLMATSSSPVRVTVTNDKSTLKTNIQGMVSTYNDFLKLTEELTIVGTEDEASGALSNDVSTIRFIKAKVRDSVFSDSSTPSGSVAAMRDIGISINQYGVAIFSESTYNAAIANNYEDVVTMLTADTDYQNLFGNSAKGLAQDIATMLGGITDATGVITNRETGSETDRANYEKELTKLESRMDGVYERYLMQFGAMETLMATMDSTKDYLTAQFESLSKVYDQK